MKKTVIILLLLALTLSLFACAAAKEETPTAAQPQTTQPTEAQTSQDVQVTVEEEDDYVRYTGGGISLLLEGGFEATTAQDGYLVFTNGFLTVIAAATDADDAQMLAEYGYDIDALAEEDYGSIVIDSNKLEKESMFYDRFDNLCLSYSGKDSGGNDYLSYSVIKKDADDHRFWLIQYIGAPAVYEPYSVYFPEWAAGVIFE